MIKHKLKFSRPAGKHLPLMLLLHGGGKILLCSCSNPTPKTKGRDMNNRVGLFGENLY